MNGLYYKSTIKTLMKKTKQNNHRSFLLIALRTNMTESKNTLLNMRARKGDNNLYLYF
jgi:hypothetical protein